MSVVVGSIDHESPQCRRCKSFVDHYPGVNLGVGCPDCDRRVSSVTNIISRVSCSRSVLEWLPACVAHENHILPFAERGRELVVVFDMTSGSVEDTIGILTFILSRPVVCLHADTVAIKQAIVRDYGPIDHEGPIDNELYDEPDWFG